jgi:hypothetical protein
MLPVENSRMESGTHPARGGYGRAGIHPRQKRAGGSSTACAYSPAQPTPYGVDIRPCPTLLTPRPDNPARIGIPSKSNVADVPRGPSLHPALSPPRALALSPLFPSSNVTSKPTLAPSHCNSNRNSVETEIAVTRTKQTTVVLSNRNKKTPPGEYLSCN